ncbi:MAG: 23S rRNA (uracil(1939)-C(5))-methyltransferase RlmD [Lachnospiraceae bacterium]|nr:23S rRNA (uracil(1939)-C(5))-methyltransferase RlmD [Lachnospiraceae bacterium]
MEEKRFQKNQEIELAITDLTADGLGVGHADGYALFVKDTVPGDAGTVRVIKTKKNYGFGRMVDLKVRSDWRVTPPCPVAGPCGGCQLMHVDYQKQLEWKRKKVEDCIYRIGGLTDVEVLPVLGMEEPWHYRNKAQYPVGTDEKGNLIAGFYAGHSHRIVANEHCLIQDEKSNQVLALVLAWMKKHHISAYDEATGKGLVRHVIVRVGKATGQIMAGLVINGAQIPAADALIDTLKTVEGMTSICLNCNRENTNVILGETTKVLWGEDAIIDRIGDVSYRISLPSFYQVNPTQTVKLYQTALDFAGLTGNETVWDLYCGIGTISLFLAQKAKQVYGVEIVEQAVVNAKENAKLNGFTNAEFFAGAAEEVMPQKFLESGATMRADVIVVDPPRKGCEEALLDTIVQMEPERIVYVSCDPATLARDLKYLNERGYRTQKVQPCEMFAQGVHIESVASVRRVV